MSKNVPVTNSLMRAWFRDLPYEIVFQIFDKLPEEQLVEIYKFPSKVRNVARDPRFWKHMFIKYRTEYERATFTFEELYSGPGPVKVLQMYNTKVLPPVSRAVNPRKVKVTKLDLSDIRASRKTVKFILSKYQCKELYFDHHSVDCQGRVMGIKPGVFAKQTALEAISLKWIQTKLNYQEWLAPLLKKCKKLKALHFAVRPYSEFDELSFVKSLPTSLEKLFVEPFGEHSPENSFFELMAERFPNLKELGLSVTIISHPALLKFQFLEALHFELDGYGEKDSFLSDLYLRLMRFPALKTVYINDYCRSRYTPITYFNKVEAMLKPHGIVVELMEQMDFTELINTDDKLRVWVIED